MNRVFFTILSGALMLSSCRARAPEDDTDIARRHEHTGQVRRPPWTGPPLAMAEPATGIIVYVESDGRHVEAADRDGKLLWHKDVVAELGLKAAADGKPPISALGKPTEAALSHLGEKQKGHAWLALTLTGGSAVLVDAKTGELARTGRAE